MSKMSELDLVLQELRTAGNAIISAADSLKGFYSKAAGTPKQAEPKPKPLTLEKVRSVLADKSRNGFTAEIRELLEKHGGGKLSEIDPKEYEALLAEAEVLGNG